MLRLWRVSNGELIVELKGHAKEIDRALAVRSFDSMIASGDAAGEIRLWDGRDGHYLRTLGKQESEVGVLRFSPDGQRLLSTCGDGKQLVSAGDDKVIRVWDWQAGRTIRTIRGQVGTGNEGMIYAMALSPSGQWLTAGGWLPGGTREVSDAIRLYDFATGKLVSLLKGHSNVVTALAFSPDSTRLISASNDNSAIIWDVERRTSVHRLRGHTRQITSVAFTPDGQSVVRLA